MLNENTAGVLRPGEDHRSRAGVDLRQDIVRYYDQCYWDYRTSWCDARTLALHYGCWDETTRSHGEALLNMNRKLADAAAIRPGETVLDAGCGLGGSGLWLAERLGAVVTGITLSAAQAAHAGKNAARRGLKERVSFQVADFCATPFPDASFDVVWAIESVCHAVDKSAFIREAYRLLKPGGRLVCTDGYARKRDFDAAEWRVLRICLDGWEIPNLATADEFGGYLRQAGFDFVTFEDLTPRILPSSRRLHWTARLAMPMQKLMRWLGLRTPAQTGNFLTALNQYYVFRDGLSCYGLFRADKRGDSSEPVLQGCSLSYTPEAS